MALTVLSARPVPPNDNFQRATFFWSGSPASADPLDTDNEANAVTNFMDDANVGNNVLFLDIWRYIGESNWTNAKRDRLHLLLDAWHRSGLKVYALCGNVDWGTNQAWVQDNIIEPLLAFNAMATSPSKMFDGIIFDVEYWTDEQNYPANTNCPGLCELMKAVKKRSNLEVGCFAAFYLKDGGSGETPRPTLTYNGKSAQDGEHMMDSCDFVVVGAYRDHAADGGSESGPGIISLFTPWYDYASQEGINCGLFCGVETIDVSPAYITFYGASKASMQTEMALVSAEFQKTTDSVFLGMAVHSYQGWSAMS